MSNCVLPALSILRESRVVVLDEAVDFGQGDSFARRVEDGVGDDFDVGQRRRISLTFWLLFLRLVMITRTFHVDFYWKLEPNQVSCKERPNILSRSPQHDFLYTIYLMNKDSPRFFFVRLMAIGTIYHTSNSFHCHKRKIPTNNEMVFNK